jgi:tRNA-dihydrouridine synthase C
VSASPLPFTAPWLLAPMEGVTDPCFRALVLAENPPAALGGAFTEFVRVIERPVPRRVLSAHLGEARFPQPVGLQLLGSDAAALAETARRAFALGVPLVDLNFGCPAKGALRSCAGSALLERPAELERLVGAVVGAAEGRPVAAKIRAGGEDDALVEELARAVEAGGASLLTVHCRTRREGYRGAGEWRRLARAAAAVGIPVCGNGGVERHADLERLRRETGCALAMVGRAALGDPWIFAGREVEAGEAARFLLAYAEALRARGAGPAGVAGRLKQLLARWRAGGLVDDPRAWLSERSPERLLGRLQARAEGAGLAPAAAR